MHMTNFTNCFFELRAITDNRVLYIKNLEKSAKKLKSLLRAQGIETTIHRVEFKAKQSS